MRQRIYRAAAGLLVVSGLLLLGVWGLLRLLPPPPHPPPSAGTLAGVTVVLDPGHGGEDSGAVCRDTTPAGTIRLREADVNYRLTAALASVLRERGARVILTVSSHALLSDLRESAVSNELPLIAPDDACLVWNQTPVRLRPSASPDDLYRRAAVAAREWTALSPQKRASGLGVYFLALHCDKLGDGQRGRGARVYRDKRSPLNPRFAETLKKHLTAARLTNSSGGKVIPRDYGVLNGRYNLVPERALLEAATLSDSGDRRAVQTARWRWKLAHLIADCIDETEHRSPH